MPRHKLPKITADNYYSQPINMAYMSASQFKSFMRCEAAALAEVRGDVVRAETDALLVGSYVDAHFSNEMEAFRAQHPGIFTRGGELKASFLKAEQVIARIERDPLFTAMLAGKTQEIRTGAIGGVPFKIKTDSLLNEGQCEKIAGRFPDMAQHLFLTSGAIVDLKVMRDLDMVWMPGKGRVPFVEAWGYDLQLAIYQAVTGGDLPCFIAAATKEEEPNIEVFMMPQEELDTRLMTVEELAPRYQAIKQGRLRPEGCGACAWCRAGKVLEGAQDYRFYGTEEDA